MFAAVSQEPEDEVHLFVCYKYISKKVKIPETCSLYLLFYWNKLAFNKTIEPKFKTEDCLIPS